MDYDILEQWQQENKQFVETKACREVEKLIRNQNIAIVKGHPGSGKASIIQHIAFKFKSQGWLIKPVKSVTEIINAYLLTADKETLFILKDPIGNELFDEIAYELWKKHETDLQNCLKKNKLLLSCRKCVIDNYGAKGIFKDKECVVDINDNKLKMNYEEKQKVWNSHASYNKISKTIHPDFQIEPNFPLLCKLYSSNEKYYLESTFFEEPLVIMEKYIRSFRDLCKETYCALFLLVLFDNVLSFELLKNETSKEKFKCALKRSGLALNTTPLIVFKRLETLRDVFVKKIGDTYHFYHDIVMEVTTFVLGSDNPKYTIRYADIGFLRRRVKLGKSYHQNYVLTIYLADKHLGQFGKRLVSEIFGERFLEVVLNPCLKNDKLIVTVIKELEQQQEKLDMLVQKKEYGVETQRMNQVSVSCDLEDSPKISKMSEEKQFHVQEKEIHQATYPNISSKLAFIRMSNGISPLCALIVFCHTQLSSFCLNALKKLQNNFKGSNLFTAVCSNGDTHLFNMFLENDVTEYLTEKWGHFYPIHVASFFHNFEILSELKKLGVDVNLKTSNEDYWTPLTLAATNDLNQDKDKKRDCKINFRRNETIRLLLDMKADINQCNKNGASPLYLACHNGYYSTVHFLLSNKANINMCNDNGASPLYIASHYGHDSIVRLLLTNKADINLSTNDGATPIYTACFNGHDTTTQILLRNQAKIDQCKKNGTSPLFAACQNGHNGTVKLLISAKADVNLCAKHGTSPIYIACQNGHCEIAQLLLNNGAYINLICNHTKSTPLHAACYNGQDEIVQLLLNEGADINLQNNVGVSPLHLACQKGRDSIVKLLCSKGADVNLRTKDGISPSSIASQNGHKSIVKLLSIDKFTKSENRIVSLSID